MQPIRTVVAFVILCLPLTAHAEPLSDNRQPTYDTVTLNLKVEDWVETSTARVVIDIDAAMPGKDAGKVRDDMLKAVSSLASGTEWRFSAFDRSEEQSGLESWHAELEARLKESDLGGLADRAKQISKPGLQMRVGNIEFTPTLAETQAVETKLRNDIYGEINDELKRLQAAQPDRKYRVGSIDFTGEDAKPIARPMMMRALAAPAPATASYTAPVTLQQKVQIGAQVVLSAVAPKE